MFLKTFWDRLDDDTKKVIGIIFCVLLSVFLLVHFLEHESSYTLDVRAISWEYIVHIEEYKVVHDDDGSYNKWVETRQVYTAGFDHSPYFGSYVLKTDQRSDGIGEERVKYETQNYYAHGVLLENSDGYELQISYDIWDRLTTDDELNFKKKRVGNPYDIQIAG